MNTIKLNGAEILESSPDENGVVRPTLKIYIPIRADYYGKRSMDEYRHLFYEDIRLKASYIFQLFQNFGDLLANNDIQPALVAEYLRVLSPIGEGLLKVFETIESDFEDYAEKQKASQSKPLDLSGLPESAQRLNKQETEKLIKKHNLPEEVSNVLRSCVEVKQ